MNSLFVYSEEELLFLKGVTKLDLAQYVYYQIEKKSSLINEIEYQMRVNNWIINCQKAWREYKNDEPLGYGLEEFARIVLENTMKNNTLKLKKK